MTNSESFTNICDLRFRSWHEAPTTARAQLVSWVRGMQWARDNEMGGGPEGAGAWLDEKLTESDPAGLFQTFLGTIGEQVVWTGSVVRDDRGAKAWIAAMGWTVDGFFGLFNTRHDFRGRGIGWAGATFADRHVVAKVHALGDCTIGLMTANPAAERHYQALGFQLRDTAERPASLKTSRIYVKRYGAAPAG